MEETHYGSAHQIQLSDRNQGTITGVTDVISFDPQEILLSTEMGVLSVTGDQLHVSHLNLEQKEVRLDGRVDALQYTKEMPAGKQAGTSLFKRMFR